MDLAKITAHGQTTIPQRIRESVNLAEGAVTAFEVEGDHLVAYKVICGQDDFSRVMSEWSSLDDKEAWRGL